MTARAVPNTFLVAFSFAGEQSACVRPIAEAVENHLGRGSVFMHEWFQHFIAGADAELKLKSIYTECSLAVVCISGRYGCKPWTRAEHEFIRARQMQSRVSSNLGDCNAILPIRVGDGEVDGIPFNTIIPDVRNRPPSEAAELILERLRLIIPDINISTSSPTRSVLWPDTPPNLAWPVADHTGVRGAFGELLTCSSPWRLLLLCGPSDRGKSHVTKQMLANAIRLPGLACGRFDFKGTTEVDEELSSFVQFLQVTVPSAKALPRLNHRLSHIMAVLKDRATPTLLVFDTYENAGEAQDWVDKQLLPNILRSPWLRVVIAGQRVPDPSGAVWMSAARPTLQLLPPPPADWFDYGKLHRDDLTIEDVETACRLAFHKASLLSQLLGPLT